MFRITDLMQEVLAPTPLGPVRAPKGPVVIWNLIRRCNLACKHCYALSGDRDYAGELSGEEARRVMHDLRAAGVPVLILSGGEPLLRPDIFDLSRHAKALGFYVGLSTNGTRIDAACADAIAAVGYDYVGVSLDGLEAVHDRFRRRAGAFRASLAGIRLCHARGIKVGLRFTLTRDNEDELPRLLDLMEAEDLDKFYLSHLNYTGRGNRNRGDDAHFAATRRALDQLFARCLAGLEGGRRRDYVTGNNDADGVYFLQWVERHFPDRAEHARARLLRWGGNSSGVNIANIDNLGNVHPDTYWSHLNLGNVRSRPFGDIWSDLSNPVFAGLKTRPRPVGGRCAHCAHIGICNGNTRIRAFQVTGDAWAEDPGCYLDDAEIGRAAPGGRIATTPYRKEARRATVA